MVTHKLSVSPLVFTQTIPWADFAPRAFKNFANGQIVVPDGYKSSIMSKVIQTIDRLEDDIQFTKFAETIFIARYIKASGTNKRNQRIRITDLSADI